MLNEKLNSAVRPFITILFALTFCFLTITGIISGDVFVGTVTMILTWWFKSRDESRKDGNAG